jgi:hypothetical protein
LRLRVAIATAVFVGAGRRALLLRGREEPNREAAPQRPTSVALHRFSASHVGHVWIRITPGREPSANFIASRCAGKLVQHADLKNLDRAHTLFTAKTSPDRIPMRINAKPTATITFGARNVPRRRPGHQPGPEEDRVGAAALDLRRRAATRRSGGRRGRSLATDARYVPGWRVDEDPVVVLVVVRDEVGKALLGAIPQDQRSCDVRKLGGARQQLHATSERHLVDGVRVAVLQTTS